MLLYFPNDYLLRLILENIIITITEIQNYLHNNTCTLYIYCLRTSNTLLCSVMNDRPVSIGITLGKVFSPTLVKPYITSPSISSVTKW